MALGFFIGYLEVRKMARKKRNRKRRQQQQQQQLDWARIERETRDAIC